MTQQEPILYKVITDFVPSQEYEDSGCMAISRGDILEVDSQMEHLPEGEFLGIYQFLAATESRKPCILLVSYDIVCYYILKLNFALATIVLQCLTLLFGSSDP